MWDRSQVVWHTTFNRVIEGSNPSGPTKKEKKMSIFIDEKEVKVGDRVYHKFRGWGTISILENENPDPSSVMVEIDDENGKTLEVSIHLLHLSDGGC